MFEFDDFSDEAVPIPNGAILIDLLDGRAVISRCRQLSDTLYVWEQCSNWHELEANVLEYLKQDDVAYFMGAFCACPETISALATWPDHATSIFALS